MVPRRPATCRPWRCRRRVKITGANHLGAGRPHHSRLARRSARIAVSGSHPRANRTPAAHGKSRRGQSADKKADREPSLGAARGGEAAAQESTHEPVAAADDLGRRRFCRRIDGPGRTGCCRYAFGGIAAIEILVAEGQTKVFFFDHFERFLFIRFCYCRSYLTTRRT